jgi:cell division septal protein FtsQ
MKKRPLKNKRTFADTRRRPRIIDPRTKLLIKQFFIGFSIFSLLAVIVTGIWYGTRIEAVTIDEILVSGGETISHDDIKSAAEGVLVGTYFGLVPKRFVYTYPEMPLWEAVAAVERVKNPRLTREGTVLKITIEEYLPFALWCHEFETAECHFIDDAGFAFTRAPILQGSSLYRFVTLGQEPGKGKIIRSPEMLSDMITFAEALEADFRFPVLRIELDTVNDAFFILTGGGEIKISLRDAPTALLENLRLVLETPEFKDFSPRANQYIDLRFGNKVFVNDSLPEVPIDMVIPIEFAGDDVSDTTSIPSVVPTLIEAVDAVEAIPTTSVDPIDVTDESLSQTEIDE